LAAPTWCAKHVAIAEPRQKALEKIEIKKRNKQKTRQTVFKLRLEWPKPDNLCRFQDSSSAHSTTPFAYGENEE